MLLTRFYRSYGKRLLGLLALTFPALFLYAESIKSNNDIETWLPRSSPVRATYEGFKRDFGVEELIVIGVDSKVADERLIESVAARLESQPGIRRCWTPARMQAAMEELGVPPEETRGRMQGLLTPLPGGTLVGMVALLTDEGLKHRAETVAEVRRELDYCQLRGDDVCLTGAPVIVTELDALGSQQAGRKFFTLTLTISLGLLYYSLRHWQMSLSLLGITLWTIFLTQSLIAVFGGEMNFILGALSVMVTIFTLSVAIHLLGYYGDALDAGEADPLGTALWESAKPCVLATITTLIGLISLNVSEILPVSQFGYAAALGASLAMFTGLGLTPCLLVLWPDVRLQTSHGCDFDAWGRMIARFRKPILAVTCVVLCIATAGLMQLRGGIDPVDFLPKSSKTVADLRRIERELTTVDSIEAVVDFKDQPDLPFLSRLEKVRELERKIASHKCVRHAMSLATMFPTEMPESSLGVVQLLKDAKAKSGDNDFLAQGDRLWRISARIDNSGGEKHAQILRDLGELTAGAPITYTGVTPLLESAQQEIFRGFWESFTSAFLVISLVMVLSLWSIPAGLVAMVPNLIPIWIVFGAVGYLGMTVDIGMMMTGSIALGISVDCTFHFLVRYKEHYRQGHSSEEAALMALSHTGAPVLDSTVVASLGMMALCLSPFAPTARFGCLMAAQMTASLLGELVLLPALLCLRPRRQAELTSTGRSGLETQRRESAKPVGRVA